jgi:ferrous iron transport protein B
MNIPESSLKLNSGRLVEGSLRQRLRELRWLGRARGSVGSSQTMICDTPGSSTLFPQSEEEMVVRDAVLRLRPSALLMVADAKNVRRSLALTLHAAELGLPMVLAVNMSDEALRQGIGLDTDRLSQVLGIAVVSTTAVEDLGTDEVRRKLDAARVPRRVISYPPAIAPHLELIQGLLDPCASSLPLSPRGMALLLMAGDRTAEQILRATLDLELFERVHQAVKLWLATLILPPEVVLTDVIFEAAEKLAAEVVERHPRRRSFLDTFGHLAQHPLWGVMIAGLVVTAMYFFVGVLGATLVVDALNTFLFEGVLIPFSARLVAPIPSELVRDAIMDPDFGLLPTGLFLAFGIVMPVLFFFFFAFGLLQSSGYLPRVSVLLDRVFRRIGLNGKGVMPLVMGLSCVTMALITTRMLDSKKERIIASFLLLLGIPCAPLLGVMLVVLAAMPVSATVTVFGVLAVQVVIAGLLANRLVPGLSPDFIMVIPPMRLPRVKIVLKQTLRQTYEFMKEAIPLFLLASLLLFAFDRIGGLVLVEVASRPLTQGLLGLPDQAVEVFIKTMVRRESGAAELARVRGGFTNLQLVVTLVMMTLLLPCVNSFIVLIKERGLRVGLTIVGVILVYAFVVGTTLSHLCNWFGVTFGG